MASTRTSLRAAAKRSKGKHYKFSCYFCASTYELISIYIPQVMLSMILGMSEIDLKYQSMQNFNIQNTVIEYLYLFNAQQWELICIFMK